MNLKTSRFLILCDKKQANSFGRENLYYEKGWPIKAREECQNTYGNDKPHSS